MKLQHKEYLKVWSSLSLKLRFVSSHFSSQAALVKDFQALRKQLEEQGLFRTRPLFYILYIGHILLLEVLPLVLLWQFGNGWIVTILSAVMLATAQVGHLHQQQTLNQQRGIIIQYSRYHSCLCCWALEKGP